MQKILSFCYYRGGYYLGPTLYRVRQLIQSMDKFACFGLYTEFENTKSHLGISLTLDDEIKSGNFLLSLNTTSG